MNETLPRNDFAHDTERDRRQRGDPQPLWAVVDDAAVERYDGWAVLSHAHPVNLVTMLVGYSSLMFLNSRATQQCLEAGVRVRSDRVPGLHFGAGNQSVLGVAE